MEQTLMLIKPDAVRRELIGEIITIVEKEGFRIKAVTMKRMSLKMAKEFYAVHRKKEFFKPLVEYMTSGPTVGIVLERENAVGRLREIVGATDPKEAAEGTIRRKFAINYRQNSVHASDSKKSFICEKKVFFKEIK